MSLHPGKRLYQFLRDLYPVGQIENSFLSKMDKFLIADTEFANIVYASCIHYLIRRLIITAQYIKRKYEVYGDERYKQEIRDFLKTCLEIPNKEINLPKLQMHLQSCLDVNDDEFSKGTKNNLVNNAKKNGHKCYVCGGDLDFENEGAINYRSVDHIWPRSLGGASEIDNAGLTCKRCDNFLKRDYLDFSDFHYEEISLVFSNPQEYYELNTEGKQSNRNRQYEVAIFAKSGFKCTEPDCQQPANLAGELYIGKMNSDDSMHFLNLTAFCQEHRRDSE